MPRSPLVARAGEAQLHGVPRVRVIGSEGGSRGRGRRGLVGPVASVTGGGGGPKMAEEAAGGGGTRRGAAGERDDGGAERGPGAAYHMFVLMEDLLDKLKLLNYEEEALRRHNMRPLSRCPSPAPPRRGGEARKAPGRAAASPGRRSRGRGGGRLGLGVSRRVGRSSRRGAAQPPRLQGEGRGCARLGAKPQCRRGEIPMGG